MEWCREKIAGNPYDLHGGEKKTWFPVDFPLNQSIDNVVIKSLS